MKTIPLTTEQKDFIQSHDKKMKAWEIKFIALTDRLKYLGFTGEVYLKAGFLLLGCFNKQSSKMIRKAVKNMGFIECKFGEQAVFTRMTEFDIKQTRAKIIELLPQFKAVA